MLFTYGSILAFLASVFLYYKPQRSLSLFAMKVIYDVKYQLLGTKELIIDRLQAKYNKVDLPLKPNKVAIVTGGSRGIGFMITKMLLQCDMEVIIACRNVTAGENAIQKIRESGVTTGRPKVYKLDNASLESVRTFAKQIRKDYTHIHILVNNAGIMFTPYEETEDGYESQWAVNYLAHFLLTALLLPLLKAGGSEKESSRIVSVTSCAHLMGFINFEDINFKKNFLTGEAYAQSKLAQVIFTITLQELFARKSLSIKSYAVHPGIVNTDLFNTTHLRWFRGILKYIFKSPEQGATPVVYAAVSKDVEDHGGIYISNCRKTFVNPIALDSNVRENLLKLSLDQVKLQDFCQEL